MITIKTPEGSVHDPIQIRTPYGVSFTIPRGTTRVVPDYVAPLAATLGCFIVETVDKAAKVVDTANDAVREAAERFDQIVEAVAAVRDVGDAAQLTSAGVPRVAAIAELVGFDVKADEIAEALEALTS